MDVLPTILNIDTSRHIWYSKYRYRKNGRTIDQSVEDTWQSVAKLLALQEKSNIGKWSEEFYRVMDGFKFIPAGRILTGQEPSIE